MYDNLRRVVMSKQDEHLGMMRAKHLRHVRRVQGDILILRGLFLFKIS